MMKTILLVGLVCMLSGCCAPAIGGQMWLFNRCRSVIDDCVGCCAICKSTKDYDRQGRAFCGCPLLGEAQQ